MKRWIRCVTGLWKRRIRDLFILTGRFLRLGSIYCSDYIHCGAQWLSIVTGVQRSTKGNEDIFGNRGKNTVVLFMCALSRTLFWDSKEGLRLCSRSTNHKSQSLHSLSTKV